ncbi:MAG: hypothetical protein LBP68_05745, partial [Acidobacteriota bacterium]|nr:hypothetical protein [Acidobacteriota bacterium]
MKPLVADIAAKPVVREKKPCVSKTISEFSFSESAATAGALDALVSRPLAPIGVPPLGSGGVGRGNVVSIGVGGGIGASMATGTATSSSFPKISSLSGTSVSALFRTGEA